MFEPCACVCECVLLELIVVRIEDLRCVHIDGDVALRIRALLQSALLALTSQPLIFLADLLRRLRSVHDLPTLRLQSLDAQRIVDGSLVRIGQHLVGALRPIEQQLGLLLQLDVHMLVGMVDATQVAIGSVDLFRSGLRKRTI